jgi:hypothetical protein
MMCMCGYRTSIRLQIHATVHSPESTLVNNSTPKRHRTGVLYDTVLIPLEDPVVPAHSQLL